MPETLRLDEDNVAWVGARRLPQGTRIHRHDADSAVVDGKQFRIRLRGFDLPFENGWTVSVRWGAGPGIAKEQHNIEEPSTAAASVTDRDGRVVVWDDNGRPIGKSLDHPGIRPEVPAEEIRHLIDAVATWSSDYLQVIDRA